MSELILPGENKKVNNKPKLIKDFDQWKLDQGAIVVSAEDAWNYQQQKIALWEQVSEQAAETIGKMKQIIDELRKFNEDNLKIISDLEIENLQLKGEDISHV